MHLSVVWKRLQSGLQCSAESCALSWVHLRVCSPLSAGYLPKRCKSSAAKITEDSNHHVTVFSFYCHLASASIAWWQKLRDLGWVSSPRPSGSQTQTQSHNINMTPSNISKIFTILHHLYCCYAYTLYNLFAHSSCTFLLILLFIKSKVYCPAHFILLHIYFIFCLYLCIFSCYI